MALPDAPGPGDDGAAPATPGSSGEADPTERDLARAAGGPTAPDDDATLLHIEAMVRKRLFVDPPAAHRIDRFVVLEPIGRGGMGVVYAAYDEQLDRKVAVKVLLEDQLPSEAEQLRFQREAQALARLSHPNVVTVHEVGHSDGQLYLAMEYIQGDSLSDWLRTEPDWPLVLDAFRQAGQGLAAAHRAGLVHRDLKPANLMRSHDGMVKVLDFGLARATNDPPEPASLSLSGSQTALSSSLTQTGVMMGTPAYMAPEQFKGETADARSDQYSFCLALWEGLTGRRPFDQPTYEELVTARMAGAPPWPNDVPKVPKPIAEALRRGLSATPQDRWPSMDALLVALAWDPQRRRPRRWPLLAGVGALALGGAAVRSWSAGQPTRCTGAMQRLAGIWDEARRTEVGAALSGAGKSYADDVWHRVSAELDAYADTWVSTHTEACEATERGEQSPRALDLRMLCLERAAGSLRAAVETLSEADATTISKAHELVAGLRPLSRCDDMEALEAAVEPPSPQQAAPVAQARQHLAKARAQRKAGHYDLAEAAVDDAAAVLEGVGYEPARTELMLERSHVLEKLGDYAAAEASLEQTLERALRWQQHDLAAVAAARLIFVVGVAQQRPEALALLRPMALGLADADVEQEILVRIAIASALHTHDAHEDAENEHRRVLALSEALPSPDLVVIAKTRHNLGSTLDARGKYEEAEAEYRAAIETMERAVGPQHPDVALLRSSLGGVLRNRGHYAESEAEYRAAIEAMERAVGPDHLHVADLRKGLGILLYSQGKYPDAEAQIRTAFVSKRESLGPQHPQVAAAQDLLGSTLYAQGRYDEAETEYRAALTARREALGPQHSAVASSRNNLALILKQQGKYAEAEVEYRAARETMLEALGPQHPTVSGVQRNLAQVLHKQGKSAEAESEFRATLALRLEHLGPEHPKVAESRTDLAVLLVQLHREDEALPLAEQAWARRQRDDIPADHRGDAAFALARALWSEDRSARPRARTLAEDAIRSYRAVGAAYRTNAEDVEQWLASHPPP